MFFWSRSKKKYVKTSIGYFFDFGRAAGFEDSEIGSVLPRMEDAAPYMAQAFKRNLRPIDGGIILADLAVRESYAKRRHAEVMSGVLEGKLSRDVVAEWADGAVEISEKIQMRAFDLGVKMGATITPSEGRIGEIMSDFLRVHPDFQKSF